MRAATLSLVGLLACRGAPTAAPTWRRSFELLGLGEDGSLIELCLTIGNTGILEGQGHSRFLRLARGEAPMIYARDVRPDQVALDPLGRSLQLAQDSLELSDTGPIDARVSNAEINARLRLERGGAAPASAAWQEGGGQWTIRALEPGGRLHVWTTAGDRAIETDGYGVLLDRGGDGIPALPRQALYLLGSGIQLGVDQQGAGRLAWGQLDGRPLDLANLKIDWHTGQPIRLDLRPAEDLVVEVKRDRPKASRDPWAHLGSWERWLARRFWEEPTRGIRAGRAKLRVGADERQTGAVIVEVTERR